MKRQAYVGGNRSIKKDLQEWHARKKNMQTFSQQRKPPNFNSLKALLVTRKLKTQGIYEGISFEH